MVIKTAESISQIFSVFHDGVITNYRNDKGSLTLEVEISYLAERVNPAFRKFEITLFEVKNVRFSPWLDNPEISPRPWFELSKIFVPELDILSGELENGQVRVVCNQPAAGVGYCGGDLYFDVEAAEVVDEAGMDYSIEALVSLSRGYWDEWKGRNRA